MFTFFRVIVKTFELAFSAQKQRILFLFSILPVYTRFVIIPKYDFLKKF